MPDYRSREARVAAGRLVLPKAERARLDAMVAKMADGPVVLKVERQRATRSTQANRRYWALLTHAALRLDDGSTADDVHEGVAWHFLQVQGRKMPMRLSTASLDTAAFSRYCDQVEAFLAVDLGLDMSGWEEHL